MADQPVKPNLFIALELDPDQKWSQEAFERQLKAKQREWSKETMRPDKKGRTAKQNLEQITNFRRIGADPELRAAEAKEARELRQATQTARIQDFGARLALLELKGHLLEEELNGLVKDFADVLTAVEIRKRIRVPIQAKVEESSYRSRAMPLEPTLAKQIRQLLDSIGQSDLYEFLTLSASAGTEQLRYRADQERIAMYRKAVKSADVTVRQELAGICIKLFESDAERQRYDETLHSERLQKLVAAVDSVAAVSRQLVQAQVDALLKHAADDLKIRPDEAKAAIVKHARTKGYAVVLVQGKETPIVVKRCGACGCLNEESKNNCTNCGRPLVAPCPKCRKPVNSDEQACGACGFPAGNRSFVQVMLSEIDAAVRANDYATASAFVVQARRAWPAPDSDNIVKDLEKRQKQIQAVIAEIVEDEKLLEKAVSDRRFYQARDLLEKLSKLRPETEKNILVQRASIDAAIKQAEGCLAKANAVITTEPDRAIALLDEALYYCADCVQARELLARLPPSPPSGLCAEVQGQIVRLSWRPSQSSDVTHVIIRKAHTRPNSAGDGQRLIETRGATYDDAEPEVGVPLFYAVFADRKGTLCPIAALLSQPVMVISDVTGLNVLVSNQTVQLTWQAPKNVHDVRIIRSQRSFPTSEGDGQLVPMVSDTTAIDRDLRNGRRYFYSVWARFLDQNGILRVSSGVQVEATPEEPPALVSQLKIAQLTRGDQQVLAVDWDPPRKGQVVILHTRQPSGLEKGAVVSQRTFGQHGTVLSSSDNTVAVPLDGLGVHYLTPAVIFQQMAYVGVEHRYVHAEEVSDLDVQHLGFALRLQWRWPQGCNEVVVVWSAADWPEPDAPGVSSHQLTRAEYELSGHFDIANPGLSDLYITVFAVTKSEGQRILAGGQSAASRKRMALGSRQTIDYSIKKAFFGGALSLQVEKRGQGQWPCLLLVRKQGALPLNGGDGEIIQRVEANEVRGDRLAISLPKSVFRNQAYARLFLEDSVLYESVVIRDPSIENLKLF